jgi:mono/diheme cytochrome c family protein
MKKLFCISTFLFGFTAISSAFANPIQRGELMVRIAGCNDCHTPQYAPMGGNVPTSQWLTGSNVGFFGPWGTTYPANLRQGASAMKENDWVKYMQNLKARPPMPSYDSSRIPEEDLRAMYKFIKSLGPSDAMVPQYLPPGKKPNTPYIDFQVKNGK